LVISPEASSIFGIKEKEMKTSKAILLVGTLGVVLMTCSEVRASAGCGGPERVVVESVETKPCCVKKKCCKPGIGSRISWGIASSFEGTGAAIGWPFRKAGDLMS